ncbi:uncharacterized protein [Nicotiana tomentosiformis]|uniref:uncharacterized protein n=1 Tax=Nicotiana tomentosiformis TaxID=4098 RepID=UPI00388C7491
MLWTPDFKPEVETPIVPVWILIHQLPCHLFKWGIVSRMVQYLEVSIAPDQATYSKFRGNIAKIKVEINLLKPKLDQIWLGFNRIDSGGDGVWLDIEYEGVPSYCLYCKIQGHVESQYRNKIRDERIKQNREERLKMDKINQQHDIPSTSEGVQNKEEEFKTVTRKGATRIKTGPKLSQQEGMDQMNGQIKERSKKKKSKNSHLMVHQTPLMRRMKTEDNDYEDEGSSEESEEYASVDSEKENSDTIADKSIKTNGALEILRQMIRLNKFSFIALVVPFDNANKLEKYIRSLGYHNAYANSNNQIWLFWKEDLDCAKCEEDLREELWNKLRNLCDNFKLSWFIVGDFNCITGAAEKKGSTPHRMSKSLSFIQCIMDCELVDAGYSGINFTWCKAWSKNTVGNIFYNLKVLEGRVAELEELSILDNSATNRAELNQVNAELIRAIKKEEEYWRQKYEIKWFVEGEINSRFFHSVFTREEHHVDLSLLQLVPRMIGEDDNEKLTAPPTLEETKDIVFSMSIHSSPGPDGISGKFYQS